MITYVIICNKCIISYVPDGTVLITITMVCGISISPATWIKIQIKDDTVDYRSFVDSKILPLNLPEREISGVKD